MENEDAVAPGAISCLDLLVDCDAQFRVGDAGHP